MIGADDRFCPHCKEKRPGKVIKNCWRCCWCGKRFSLKMMKKYG